LELRLSFLSIITYFFRFPQKLFIINCRNWNLNLTIRVEILSFRLQTYQLSCNFKPYSFIFQIQMITTEIIISNAWKKVQWKNATWNIIPKGLVKSINNMYNTKSCMCLFHSNLPIYEPDLPTHFPLETYFIYTNLLFFLCLFMSPWLSLNIPLGFSHMCSWFPF
jgi:hypothetical protein